MHSWFAELSVHLAVKLAVVGVAAVLSRLLALGKHLWEKPLQQQKYIADNCRLLTGFEAVLSSAGSYTCTV